MKMLKKNIKVYLFIFLFFLFESCARKKDEITQSDALPCKAIKEDFIRVKRIEKIRNDLFISKRISTLKTLWYVYEETNQRSLILSDAFYMANVNNDPFACHLIFEGYLYLYFPHIEYTDNINKGEYFFKLPKKEREIIIPYLEKGAEQKFFKCIDDLIEIYEYEKNPKSEYYKNIKDIKYIHDFY